MFKIAQHLGFLYIFTGFPHFFIAKDSIHFYDSQVHWCKQEKKWRGGGGGTSFFACLDAVFVY